MSPPPAAPPETPPVASAGPAAPVGSPQTARREFRTTTTKKTEVNQDTHEKVQQVLSLSQCLLFLSVSFVSL